MTDDILRILGQIEGKVDGICDRLDISNGRIAKNEAAIKTLEINDAKQQGAWKIATIVATALSTAVYFVLNKVIKS